MNEKVKVLAVIGATASGKSEYGLKLAKDVGGEIISGDSMQVYRDMNIGTAKPSPEERALVPHHLIDIADISQPFSVADYIQQAQKAIEDISYRGKTPIIVGGTGMYIELLLSGVKLAEDEDSEVRDALTARAQAEGIMSLFEELTAIDPISAQKIHPNNQKRVIRALEIYYTTGKSKTELDKESLCQDKPYDSHITLLQYKSREALYNKINARVDIMFEQGLEAEVEQLYERGIQHTKTASQAIGYKEFYPYFEGEADLGSVKEAIKQHTRNYAKRQFTYFSRMKPDRVLEID